MPVNIENPFKKLAIKDSNSISDSELQRPKLKSHIEAFNKRLKSTDQKIEKQKKEFQKNRMGSTLDVNAAEEYHKICNKCLAILNSVLDFTEKTKSAKKKGEENVDEAFTAFIDNLSSTLNNTIDPITTIVAPQTSTDLQKMIDDTINYSIAFAKKRFILFRKSNQLTSNDSLNDIEKEWDILEKTIRPKRISDKPPTKTYTAVDISAIKIPHPKPSGIETLNEKDIISIDTEIIFGSALGAGAFGQVYKATLNAAISPEPYIEKGLLDTTNDGVVAVKKSNRNATLQAFNELKRKQVWTDEDTKLNDFMDEIVLGSEVGKLKLPHCAIQTPGIYNGNYAIVCHYESGGPIEKYFLSTGLLAKDRAETVVSISKKLMIAMQALHDHNFIHRDIAARNFLINADQDPILSDFGRIKRIGKNPEDVYNTDDPTGPLSSMSVQSLEKRQYSRATDHFEMKVAILEIIALGAGLPSDIIYPGGSVDNATIHMYRIKGKKDEGYLKLLIENLEKELLKYPNDLACQQMNMVLKEFRHFMLTVHEGFDTQADYLSRANQLFDKCSNLEMIKEKANKISAEKYKHDLSLPDDDPSKYAAVDELMKAGNLSLLTALFKDGTFRNNFLEYISTNLDNRNDENNTVIKAMHNNNVDFLKLLLDNGRPVDQKNKVGGTWLHFAAYNGFVDAAQLLVNYQADIFAEDNDGLTPIDQTKSNPSHAVYINENRKKISEIFDPIIKQSYDESLVSTELTNTARQPETPSLNEEINDGDLLLYQLALATNNEEQTKFVIEKLLTENKFDTLTQLLQDESSKNTIIRFLNNDDNLVDVMELINQNHNPEIINILTENGWNNYFPPPPEEIGMEETSESASNEEPEPTVSTESPNVSSQTEPHSTENVEMEEQEPVEHLTTEEFLQFLQKDNLDKLKQLLQDQPTRKKFIEFIDENNINIVVTAFKNKNPELISVLIENGRDVNKLNSNNLTWLHYAVAIDNLEIAKILLKHGADPSISPPNLDYSPIQAAEQIAQRRKVDNTPMQELLNGFALKNEPDIPAPKESHSIEDVSNAVNEADTVDVRNLNFVLNEMIGTLDQLVLAIKDRVVEPNRFQLFSHFPVARAVVPPISEEKEHHHLGPTE